MMNKENQDTSAPVVPVQEDQPKAKEQVIDPWNVSGEVAEDGTVKPIGIRLSWWRLWMFGTNKRIDYEKLIEQFGTKLIDDALLKRFERLTGQKPHRFLRRQIAFSHWQLDVILDKYEKKGKISRLNSVVQFPINSPQS
jgi:tryptophanyl-tRNA synthetase